MIIETFLTILFWTAFAALILTAVLSPIETLSWWAGWSDEEIRDPEIDVARPHASHPDDTQTYIIYLSGVASISGRFLLPREQYFLKMLNERIPTARIITDVFPYSPSGSALTAQPRIFDQLWRSVQKLKLQGRRSVLGGLINIRNIFQVMTSADHRYGPIYNQGTALVIEKELLRAGYQRGSGSPIAIIGYSGGGQVGVGAATFLRARLRAQIDVISIGGVIASGPGLRSIRQLHHIIGSKDPIHKLGAIFFPERWKMMAHSEWNLALREDRIKIHPLDAMRHAGPRGYFGRPKINNHSNSERTVDMVANILKNTSYTD